jgi:predicted DNA-binding transcriptional regulator AlpA
MNSNTTNDPDQLTDWRPIAAYMGLKKNAFWLLFHRSAMPHYQFNSRVIKFRLSEVKHWQETTGRRGNFPP